MSRSLTKPDVIERLHALPSQSYALIANVAKGIALGVAGLALFQILANIQTEWGRLLPWAASIAAVLVSYTKWTRGTLLMNARTNLWDSCFPMFMGILEFLLFAILMVDNGVIQSHQWLNWPLVIGVHALTASALVNNRLKLTDVTRDFAPELGGLGDQYKRWLKTDRAEAAFTGAVAVVLWACIRLRIIRRYSASIFGEYIVILFALACIVAACKPLRDAVSQLKQIDTFVTRLAELAPCAPSDH